MSDTKYITVFDQNGYVSGDEARFDLRYALNVMEFINDLTEILESVPSEYREETYISVDKDPEESGFGVRIYYECPKTDEDRAEEAAKHNAYVTSARAMEDARDRREYERLKAKYGE